MKKRTFHGNDIQRRDCLCAVKPTRFFNMKTGSLELKVELRKKTGPGYKLLPPITKSRHTCALN